jgi:hypothetical protein
MEEFKLFGKPSGDGSRAFCLHATCYSLVREFFHPEPVPVLRILDILTSLPFAGSRMIWGHTHGGIYRLLRGS